MKWKYLPHGGWYRQRRINTVWLSESTKREPIFYLIRMEDWATEIIFWVRDVYKRWRFGYIIHMRIGPQLEFQSSDTESGAVFSEKWRSIIIFVGPTFLRWHHGCYWQYLRCWACSFLDLFYYCTDQKSCYIINVDSILKLSSL